MKASTDKKDGIGKLVSYKRTFALIHRLAPGAIAVMFFASLTAALSPLANIYLSARIVGELLGALDFATLLFLVVLLVTVNLVLLLLSRGLQSLGEVQSDRLNHTEHKEIAAVFLSTDFERLEDPSFQNRRREYHDLRNLSGTFLNGIVRQTGTVVQGLCAMLIAAAMTFTLFFGGSGGSSAVLNSSLLSAAMIVVIIGVAIACAYISGRGSRKLIGLYMESVHSNRFFFYYNALVGNYRNGKEIRLYKEQNLIKKIAVRDMLGSDGLARRINKNNARHNGATAALSALLSGIVYLFVGLKALSGAIAIAGVVQYVGAISQFSAGLIQAAASFADVDQLIGHMATLFAILDTPPLKYQGTLPVEKREDNEYEIEFREVSFRYPGAGEYALKNLNLKLRIGERLAVVGMNGSGKTTMVKLLCRLYDPTEGVILLNGIDIRKYSEQEYLRIFSVVFQDFSLLAFPLGQNVAASTEVDGEKGKMCLIRAGLDAEEDQWARGLETPLYRDFEPDGVELSGGEAQKIAMARALYKNAPFVVLDEPTAALDPLAEFDIYSRFDDLVGNRTAIFISHRLSSCRFCHDIAVFHEGELVQRGSHEELLEYKEGKYAQLWNAQAQYYV